MSGAALSEVWLVRHGPTEWSEVGRHTGRTDLPLTDTGREVAASLRDRLADLAPTVVLASPLQRARETCDLAGFGDAAVLDPDLMEWDYGEAEGRTTAEFRETIPGWSVWTHALAGGESLDDLAARADRVVGRLAALEGTVVVFAHGHFLRVLAARWCSRPPVLARHLLLETAGVSVLGWDREQRVIHRWNA